jgi:hypothetical protein
LWNRLDPQGAELLATRQLHKSGEMRALTPEEAAPVSAAAEKYQQVERTKSLADEVMDIVMNKKEGEALTDEEVAKIKEFREQVKDISGKVRKFLPEDKNEVIKRVEKKPPAERTSEDLLNYWQAREDRAKAKLAKLNSVGILPNTNSPILLYAEIGVSKLAKGLIKFEDFAAEMIKDYGSQVKPYINQVYDRALNKFRKSQGLPTQKELETVLSKAINEKKLDQTSKDNLEKWAAKVAFFTDDNLRLEAIHDLQKAMRNIGSSTFGEKISTIQTANQLLNSVTIERNALGGASSWLQEKLNKVAAVPIDWAFSKITGERTIQFVTHNQEGFWRNFLMGGKSGWEGVSPKGTLESYDLKPNVFGEKNPLKYLTKSLGASLQSFDYAFNRSAYGDVLATYAEQLGKRQGLTKAQIKQQMPSLIKQLDQTVYELAEKAGEYATYQNTTLLSKGAEFIKKGANAITDAPVGWMVDKGILPKKFSTEGFGGGDILVKYAKTPANLVMMGIDYSPLGFVRGMMEIAPLFVKNAKFDQFAATRALSRAITGTVGFTAMGYALADVGILTGSYSLDKDVRSLEEQSGQGSYKVNWSALGRYIMSGLDLRQSPLLSG